MHMKAIWKMGMRGRLAAAVLGLGLLSGPALAAPTVTAICRDPAGYSVGYESGRPEWEKDGIRGATWSYTWNTASQEARLVLQSVGGQPVSEKALAVASESGFVTFVVRYPRALWVHTLYLRAGAVIVSQHSDGRGSTIDSASGKLMTLSCRISSQ